MARQGGIGIIHKNMSIEAQAEEVDKVKRSENGVITDPFSLTPEHTLKDADELMAKFRISGVPITEGRKLVGIITNRDLKFETDFSKKIKEQVSMESEVEKARMLLDDGDVEESQEEETEAGDQGDQGDQGEPEETVTEIFDIDDDKPEPEDTDDEENVDAKMTDVPEGGFLDEDDVEIFETDDSDVVVLHADDID